jgi:hypothetical protein
MTNRRTNMFLAKEINKTEKGNRYIVYQDGPASFHISVDTGNCILYDHVEHPQSLDDIKNKIREMEEELLSKTQTQSNT